MKQPFNVQSPCKTNTFKPQIIQTHFAAVLIQPQCGSSVTNYQCRHTLRYTHAFIYIRYIYILELSIIAKGFHCWPQSSFLCKRVEIAHRQNGAFEVDGCKSLIKFLSITK